MKWFGLAFLVAVLLGSGGVGYACGVGGAAGGCGTTDWLGWGHSCQPTQGLVWQNPSGTTPSPGTTCTLSLTSEVVSVDASGLAPGQGCLFHAVLANVGTTDLFVTESVTIWEPGSCPHYQYSDNLPTSPFEIKAGHAFDYVGIMGLGAAAGNSCQGSSSNVWVALTGTSQSQCNVWTETHPGDSASLPLWNC